MAAAPFVVRNAQHVDMFLVGFDKMDVYLLRCGEKSVTIGSISL